MEEYRPRIFGNEMDKGEIGIGVITEPIIIWTNSAGREFEWGHVGMTVDILSAKEEICEIVDLDRAAIPISVPKKFIGKIEVSWMIIE